jgi:hypothetical protein
MGLSSVVVVGHIRSGIAGERSLGRSTRKAGMNQKYLVVIVSLLYCCSVGGGAPVLQVPLGFSIKRVAGPPEINFPMFATVDDKDRLYAPNLPAATSMTNARPNGTS